MSAAQAHPGSSSSSEEAGHPQGLHDYKGKNSHYKAADNADYEAVAGGTPAPGSTGSTGHTAVLPVRALVAPLLLHGDASAKRLTAVALDWACQGSAADLAAGSPSRGRTLGSKLMHPVGHPAAADTADEGHQPTGTDPAAAKYPYNLAEPQVFAAGVPLSPGELASQCSSSGSSVLLLQVTVHDDAGGVSTSELRPVVLAHTAGGSSDGSVGAHGFSTSVSHGAAAARGHLPLPSSVAEETLLTFDGGAFAVGLFMTGWLAQLLGLLLVPRCVWGQREWGCGGVRVYVFLGGGGANLRSCMHVWVALVSFPLCLLCSLRCAMLGRWTKQKGAGRAAEAV